MKRFPVWLAPALLAPTVALAVTTQSFMIDTSEAFEKGKLDGTAVHADGKVTRALPTVRTPIDGAAIAYASAVGPDQAIYVGTGNQGQVHRVDERGASLFASTGAPVASALVWVGDTLYVGTLEQGKVVAVDRKGQLKEFAKLPGAAHVWALAYEATKGVLYAATGPQGKLFAIDKAGRAKVVHDDEAEHLLALAIDGEGRKYVGTSNGARLLRIQGVDARVLYDAPGQELTTLALGPGFVAIASNEFSEPSADPPKDVSFRARRSKAGKGRVLSVSFDGLVEELYRSEAAHITALDIDAKQDAVLVGLGHEGRIVRVKKGLNQATWFDADERQIVAVHLADRVPHFVSSDGVALYRLVAGGHGAGLWTSAALDAKAHARFGALTARKKGSITFRTRSGNTETPDPSWSSWSEPQTGGAPIQSAPARFLQVQANLKSADAELYALEGFYAPQNLPAYVRNVRANIEREKPSPSPGPTPSASAKTQVTLTWDVDNPDGDKLRYRLYYKRDGQETTLPLLPEHEILDKTEQRWETVSLPDGYYRVRVEASDELSTPAVAVTKSEATSAPILVDNHPPLISELRLSGKRLSGRADDALGPVSLLELSLDGGFFRVINSEDGLFDGPRESFAIDLGALGPGVHVAAIRATDAARNTSTAALEFTF